MEAPKLIIFDLDGTLIDSLPDLTDATNLIRGRYGLSALERDDVRRLVGKGARNLVERALPGVAEAEVDRALEIFLSYNLEHIADKTRPYPGVPETLPELAAYGAPLVVLSNKNVDLCCEVLVKLGIRQHFSRVFGADSFPYRKPSPEPVLAVLREYGVAPGHSLMIGDSINDIASGGGAGVVTVGCSYGYGDNEEIAGANYRVDDFPSLLRLPFFIKKA